MSFHQFQRKVNYYETDAMTYMHHSNYLKLCEEARVDWASTEEYALQRFKELSGLGDLMLVRVCEEVPERTPNQ